MGESELRKELAQIDKDNQEYQEKAKADALAGRERDTSLNDFLAYRDTYSKSLGVKIWESEKSNFSKTLASLTPDQDPEAILQKQLDELIGKGADPVFEASLRQSALSDMSGMIYAWNQSAHNDVTDKTLDARVQEFSINVSKGIVPSVDDLEKLRKDIELILPVGKKSSAPGLFLKTVFDAGLSSEKSGAIVSQLLDYKMDNGLTLREMGGESARKFEEQYIANLSSIDSGWAYQDLTRIENGLADGTVSPTKAIQDLMSHRNDSRGGISSRWDTVYQSALKGLVEDAKFSQFVANVEGKTQGNPNAILQSDADWNKYGDKYLAHLYDNIVQNGGSPDQAKASVDATIIANRYIPSNIKNQAQGLLTSPNPNDRISGYNLLKGINAADSPLVRSAVGEYGYAVFDVVNSQVTAGIPVEQAVANSMLIKAESAQRWRDYPIGDNKDSTIAASIDRVVGTAIDKYIPGADGGWFGSQATVSPGLRASIEQDLRRASALFSEVGGKDAEYVEDFVAKGLLSKSDLILQGGNLALADRNRPALQMIGGKAVETKAFTLDELNAAKSGFNESMRSIGQSGVSLSSVGWDSYSKQGVPGAGVRIDVDGMDYPFVARAGQKVSFAAPTDPTAPVLSMNAGVQSVELSIPKDIGPDGWMPEQMQEKLRGFRFYPMPHNKDMVTLRFIGESMEQRIIRELQERQAERNN